MTYRLYDFAPSPFCIKVRAIFDYKGVDYERVDVRGPAWLALKRRSPTGKVPALDVDGQLVTDSTDIATLLDERHPEPPLLPDDPAERARCHLLEDWADESLYWYGLYYRWEDREGRRTAGAAFPWGMRSAMVGYLGRGARQRMAGQGIGKKPPATVADEAVRHLEHLAVLVDSGWLLGERPWRCDFAVAAQLLYLSRTPFGGPRVAHHAALTDYLERFRALRGR